MTEYCMFFIFFSFSCLLSCTQARWKAWVYDVIKMAICVTLITILSQGPLNIWTEHSNCQIHSRGNLKTLIALLIPNIFLIYIIKVFFYAYKSWGHIQFDIFHVFVENSVNSELCFFWALLKPAKIWNLSKNAHVWAA